MDDAARCRAEIEELHACFAAWFRAEPGADLARCEAVLAPGFEIASPRGRRLAREELMRGLEAARGANAGEEFELEVRDPRVSAVSPGVFLVTYEEWQRERGRWRCRLSTALLRDAPGRPRDLEWLAVHETWCAGHEGEPG